MVQDGFSVGDVGADVNYFSDLTPNPSPTQAGLRDVGTMPASSAFSNRKSADSAGAVPTRANAARNDLTPNPSPTQAGLRDVGTMPASSAFSNRKSADSAGAVPTSNPRFIEERPRRHSGVGFHHLPPARSTALSFRLALAPEVLDVLRPHRPDCRVGSAFA